MAHRAFGLLVLGLGLVGCGSTTPVEETVAEDNTGGARTQEEVATTGGEAEGGCQIVAVHFDYDSSDLSSAARDQIASNARCVQERHAAEVTVTGKADPRGTEEYNLALGERRARTVTQYMSSMGVEGTTLQAHSVGEEFANGTDESTWAEDRRTDFDAR